MKSVLQSALEWVASNKLVLNVSKSIVFGTNDSLSFRPQLNLVRNGVAIEETKLLGVTVDCKLSWSKHIQCLAKVFGPLELCDLLPHFRLQT